MDMTPLPIDKFEFEILKFCKSQATGLAEQVLLLQAETGAGKSTRVPQMILRAGHSVIVTQPRRMAARLVAERVASEVGCPLGTRVGYRTGLAEDRKDSATTECLFVTDGLALVRQIMGHQRHSVLIIDEVHEWNLSLETLVAWVRGEILAGAGIKVILMSATVDLQSLQGYFGGCVAIHVPGRTFPVEVLDSRSLWAGTKEKSIANASIAFAREGKNVLTFLPGKREIDATIAALAREGVTAYPLHGEQSRAEQAAVVAAVGKATQGGVVVCATNVAQTSVTIDGVDAVVDSGECREMVSRSGIDVLQLIPISKADSAQRKGRAGRTRPGVYVNFGEEGSAFATPEILRVSLDSVYLRLAAVGIAPEGMRFFHAPPQEDWSRAKTLLQRLHLLTENGDVTPEGRYALNLGVSPRIARILIEAERRGCVKDVINLVAVLENPIVDRKVLDDTGHLLAHKFMGRGPSDLVNQVRLLEQVRNPGRAREFGCRPVAVRDAIAMRDELKNRIQASTKNLSSSNKEIDWTCCILAGSPDRIYRELYGEFYDSENVRYQAGVNSTCTQNATQNWRVATPIIIQTPNRRYCRFLSNMVAVDATLLAEVHPWIVVKHLDLATYDPESDRVVQTQISRILGREVQREQVPCSDMTLISGVLADQLLRLS